MKEKMPFAINKRKKSLEKKKKSGFVGFLDDDNDNPKNKLIKLERNRRKNMFFTKGFMTIEKKFSDIVKAIMTSPALKRKIKKKGKSKFFT